MSEQPIGQRLSDADRDQAIAMLREHFEAGRLDPGEFDERMTAALAARYPADLAGQFVDLPAPHPDALGSLGAAPTAATPFPVPAPYVPSATTPRTPSPTGLDSSGPASMPEWLPMARKALWPVAILLGLMLDSFGLFLVLAIVGSIVLKQMASKYERTPPPYLPPDQNRPGIGQ